LGRVELVNFLLRRHRYAQAIAIVENEIDPGMNGAVVARLNVAAARGMLEAGYGDPMPFLEGALRSAPGYGLALTYMERVLTERGDTAGLERLHEQELLAPLAAPEDFVRRSHRLLTLNRDEEALYAAEQGLQIAPNNAELRFNGAMAALRLGDDVRATRELGRIDQRDTGEVFGTAMQMRAALLLRQGAHAEALAALEQRLTIMPGDVNAILDSARALAGSGANTEACTLLQAHVDTDQQIALELAGLLLKSGDIAGAGRVAAAALK
jgi:tetratricopeptide (TPR) repeat protein